MHNFYDICKSDKFIIPKNQRGFSWGKSHVEQLFNDLTVIGTDSHYMGPLIVTEIPGQPIQDAERNNLRRYYVDDGQQRLTALMIAAAKLAAQMEKKLGRENLEVKELKNIYSYPMGEGRRELRLENENKDLDAYFEHCVIGAPAPRRRVLAMQRMSDVSSYIENFFEGMKLTDLRDWMLKFKNQCLFIEVDLAKNFINRYLAFDAINSRGLPLGEFDKIKNFCILLAETRGLKLSVDQKWFEAIENLEKFGVSSRANETEFISDLFCSFHGSAVTSSSSVHDQFVDVYKPLLVGKDAHLEAQLSEFVKFWPPYSTSFGFVSCKSRTKHPRLASAGARRWLEKIDRLNLLGICRALLSASHLRLTKKEFDQVVELCEKFIFRIYALEGGRRVDYRATDFLKLSNEILHKKITKSDGVKVKFCKWLGSDSTLQALIDVLSNGGAKYYFSRDMKGWRHCYYFLYEYEQWVSPRARTNIIQWESSEDGKKDTQEHIMPQQHRTAAWKKVWPNENEADRWMHRLGNLVLTPGNAELGNKDFGRKLNGPGTHFYKHRSASNSEKRIEKVVDAKKPIWNKKAILAREHEMIASFAVKRWSLNCDTDYGKFVMPDEYSALGDAYSSFELKKPRARKRKR